VGQNHPSKMKDEDVELIKQSLKIYPGIKATELKVKLNLSYSLPTIIKKINFFQKLPEKSKQQNEFQLFHFKQNRENYYIIKHPGSKLITLGITNSEQLTKLGIFLNYFFCFIKPQEKVIITTPSKYFYNRISKSSELNRFLVNIEYDFIFDSEIKLSKKENDILNLKQEVELLERYLKILSYNTKMLKNVDLTAKNLKPFLKYPLEMDKIPIKKINKFGPYWNSFGNNKTFSKYIIEVLIKADLDLKRKIIIDLKKLYKIKSSIEDKIVSICDNLLNSELYLVGFNLIKLLKNKSPENFAVKLQVYQYLLAKNKKNAADKELAEIEDIFYNKNQDIKLQDKQKFVVLVLNKFTSKGEYNKANEWFKCLKELKFITKDKVFYDSVNLLISEIRITMGMFDECKELCNKHFTGSSRLDSFNINQYHKTISELYLVLHDKEKVKISLTEYAKFLKKGTSLKEYYKLDYLYVKGKYKLLLKDFHTAQTVYQEFFKLSLKYHNKEYLADAYLNEGVCYWYLKKYKKSINSYLKSLKIALTINDKPKLSRVNGNLALSYSNIDELNKALEYNKIFSKYAKELQEIVNQFSSLNIYGLTYMKLKDYNKAEKYFKKQLAFSNKHNLNAEKGYSYNNLALLALELKEEKKALTYFNKALKLFTTLKSAELIAVMFNMTMFYKSRDINKYKKCKDKILEDIKEFKLEKNYDHLIKKFFED